MSDRDEAAPPEPVRPKVNTQHLAGATPAAKRVAGARRNPNVVGFDEDTPRWLRAAAGWSWRLIVIVIAIGLVFFGTAKVLLLFIAVFLALVATAVLRPVVNLLSHVMPRGLAAPLAMIFSFAVFAGLLAYVGVSVAGQWADLGRQFNDGIGAILDNLQKSPLHIKVTSQNFQDWIDSAQKWVADNSGTIASQA